MKNKVYLEIRTLVAHEPGISIEQIARVLWGHEDLIRSWIRMDPTYTIGRGEKVYIK